MWGQPPRLSAELSSAEVLIKPFMRLTLRLAHLHARACH